MTARPGQQAARRSPSTCPHPTAPGSCCSSSAPRRSRAGCASRTTVAVTDTTFRDAHQSLLATRVRSTRPARRRRPPRAEHPAAAGRSSAGAARRTTWRCASSPRTRGSGSPRCARRCRTSASRCCCAAATRSATRRTRPRSPTAFVKEAADDRHRRVPHLRRAQRRRADAAGDRGGPRDRDHGRRGGALLHRRPLQPRREALHARLLPAAGRADRRRRARTCWRSRTWPACSAPRPRARWSPRCASGSTCRCTCTPTTPRAASSATLLAAIDAGVDAVDAACASMAGTTSQPPLSALVSATDHSDARDRAVARGGQRAGALLGGGPPGLRAVRVRAARADRPGLPPRDPRRPALQPAPAGDRARPRREVRAGRGHVRRGQRHPRPHRQGDAVVEGGRRPRAARWSRLGADPAEFAENPAKFDIPDSVIGFLSGELGDPPGGWPEPFRTKALEGRSWKPSASELTAEQSAALAEGSSRTRRATLNELLFPGPTRDFLEARATFGDVSVLPTRRLPLRAAARRGARGQPRGGQDDHPRARRRSASPTSAAIRTVMATINGQLRPISVRDRVGRRPRWPPPRRPTRRSRARSAAPFQGVGHARGRRGRQGRGRRRGRHHRGDEDGGLDHRAGRRHRRAAGARPAPRPSRAATSSS